MRAVVLVSSADDRALTERVRGQTSDLDAEITTRDARSIAPTFEARMREADTLARQTSVDTVIWFRVAGGGVVVYAAVPAQDRVLVRSLGGGTGKPASSTLEAAALVVRDVLRALAQGATVGETREPPTGEDDAHARPPLFVCALPVCAEPLPPLLLTSPNGPRRTPFFVSSAGWQVARARDAPSVVQALELRLGAQHETFFAALVLTLGAIDVERVTQRADILVRRHALTLSAGKSMEIGPDVSVGVGVVAGAVAFVRATRSLSPAFTPTESRADVRPLVGPEMRLSCSVAPSLAAVFAFGVDVVPGAPRFEVVTVPGRSFVYGLADVQPRLSFGLEWSRLHSR